ncbi:thiol peroxidase [Staphylococcus gallinarum]|uniref:Bacterioferritin comigratory protein n=1 Tax=Staphylococcus gallinarum TaxID=1293 RepID=A0A380FIF0_STAGA|nr:thiol peroxidase [Staphylococcus gallinarum]
MKQLKGNKTVLYFYPRDNTPTCTTEACDFRDNLASFNELGVNVFGISGDSKKKTPKLY